MRQIILNICIVILTCLMLPYLNAQVNSSDSVLTKKNSLYLELAGLGIAYSINYDHLFILNETSDFRTGIIGFGLRAGFSTFHYGDRITTIPIEGYFTYGNKWNLELGVSNIFIFEQGYDNYSGQAIRLGGKYRGPKGFLFFCGGCLTFNIWGDYADGADPYPYLGFGFSF